MKETIVVTGGNGSVAQEIFRQGNRSYEMILLSKQQLDVANERQVKECLNKIKPTIIFHTAAITDVEACERNSVKAMEANGLGTYYVAREAKKLGAKLIYLSSDYVFDGQKQEPYEEDDAPSPLSVYGISKFIGEKFVRSLLTDALIIRTSWLYGGIGKSFVQAILDNRNKDVQVVYDKVGSPTYIRDLVKTMFNLLEHNSGIYHVANSGSCSRFELAKTVFKIAGFDATSVQPIASTQLPLQAPRPAYSVLSSRKLSEMGLEMRHWQEALNDYMGREGLNDRRSKSKGINETL